MNPNLLTFVELPSKRQPVMVDRIPVSEDPDAGPFLITSSRSVAWVEQALRGGFLRIAVRQRSVDDLFRSLVEAVVEKGVERGWGNVLPSTKQGVLEGLAHLSFYGLVEAELLYGSDFDIGIASDLSRVPVEWLPPTWGVLVPGNREFVGTAFLLREGHVGAVVHNPSRGVVVLGGF